MVIFNQFKHIARYISPRLILLILISDFSLIRPLSAQLQHFGGGQQIDQYHKRFEYKHSFRAPHLADKDGRIHFWTLSGDAIAHSQQIRLAPSMTSKAGAVWNNRPMIESEFWSVEMSLKISGRGRIGADGLAFWYTAAPSPAGHVFGSSELWTGLGIFFDSFDNDYNKDAPFIGMMINDGTRRYDQSKDGAENIVAKCQKDFRNKPYPVKARIEYLKNTITVLVHNGNTANDQFDMCFKAENIFLPKSGYFGLSAATGGLADDHDVTAFEVWSLNPSRPQPPAMMPVEEQKKLEEEYKRQEEQFKQDRERFQKEHPEKVKLDEEEEKAKAFQDPIERDILSIFEGQNSIFNVLQQMDSKINQITTQQETLIQYASQMAGRPAAASGHVALEQGIQRTEALELVQSSRELTLAIREMKSNLVDLQNRVMSVESRVVTQQPIIGSASQGDMDYQKVNIEVIRREVEQIRAHQRTQTSNCPTLDSTCLSSTFFLVIIFLQSVLFFLYMIFKGRNGKAKFY
uniref:L-type lectin-like domain-containing protein n=1 Tax=Romanomermis culicivorax TaxID=13658 RepID=A0A915KKI4_ROMCU